MLKYEDVKNKPRELLAATGLKAEEFDGLLAAFSQVYTTTVSRRQNRRRAATPAATGGWE